MKIGLIDVDGHNFPNLALMRISAWHKAQGDTVEWWWGWDHYDIVYMSKVFSFSPDADEPLNADKIVKGGTGYAISLVDGREVYDKTKDPPLPAEVEEMFPDYSIYPQYDFAVALTSRGCPRSCAFCHVSKKEGRCSVKVADLSRFWNGQKEIVSLDPNITACREKRDLFRQYRESKALVEFSQGLDIRLIDDADIADINAMRIKNIHFAWDNPHDDLVDKFAYYAKYAKHKPNGGFGTVYCLTNFNSTMEENLFRVYKLIEMGYDPYIMVYDKEHAPKDVRRLQRWCNSVRIRKTEPDFSKYSR